MKTLPLLLVLLVAILPLKAPASPVSVREGASSYEASSSAAPAVRDLVPAPGSTLRAFYPRLSVRIESSGAPLRARSVRVYVDGTDVSARATFSGNELAYVPQERMRAGWHDVFIEGADAANNTFGEAWVFRSQNPDIEEPIEDDGFAFVPVGLHHGRFAHFFLVSPFDGFGLLQLCGFEVPLVRAGGTPVFFVTVPVTIGSVLLGCTPGLAFTPVQAGIGVLNPIFFPIGIAGPGMFNSGGDHHRRHPLLPAGAAATMPVYRSTTTPVYGSTTMPVYRSSTMPVYRSSTIPVYRSNTMPVYRSTSGFPAAAGAPVRAAAPTAAGTVLPTVAIPRPYIPH